MWNISMTLPLSQFNKRDTMNYQIEEFKCRQPDICPIQNTTKVLGQNLWSEAQETSENIKGMGITITTFRKTFITLKHVYCSGEMEIRKLMFAERLAVEH